MKAFVLITLHGAKERQIASKLRSFKEVKDVYILFGEWDILAEIEVADPDQLGTFVMDNIRSNPEVKLTSSLIVAGK